MWCAVSYDIHRLAFGFVNPNHAAAAICAAVPFLWMWQVRWFGWALSAVLVVVLVATQSRTGLLVFGAEAMTWWCISRRGTAVSSRPPYRHWMPWIALTSAGMILWWMWPRLMLDDSILNRPRIWLAGLQLFAANPNGVGLGNSGAVASAFLLDGIPEVRTMISAHITLLAEFGWIIGWVWFAFIGLALCGVWESPRIGLAFAGLALSGCSSTVFDWPVLFDFAEQGRLGMMNWVLSWTMFMSFVGFGMWLILGRLRRSHRGRPAIAVVLAGVVVLGLRLLPAGDAPQVRDGYVIRGDAPRTLALYDETWKLKTVAQRMKGGAVLPVCGVSRFPRELCWTGINNVILFGNCREWECLIRGVSIKCVEK